MGREAQHIAKSSEGVHGLVWMRGMEKRGHMEDEGSREEVEWGWGRGVLPCLSSPYIACGN